MPRGRAQSEGDRQSCPAAAHKRATRRQGPPAVDAARLASGRGRAGTGHDEGGGRDGLAEAAAGRGGSALSSQGGLHDGSLPVAKDLADPGGGPIHGLGETRKFGIEFHDDPRSIHGQRGILLATCAERKGGLRHDALATAQDIVRVDDDQGHGHRQGIRAAELNSDPKDFRAIPRQLLQRLQLAADPEVAEVQSLDQARDLPIGDDHLQALPRGMFRGFPVRLLPSGG
mmetsp:Transcript_101744/g.258663  ORF Transcript_101744/g.258663 Transcript_101744/m.258663 type:complete len:229 (-) Transcript_101744:1642-2328(-)